MPSQTKRVRIIAGRWKGRSLDLPRGARPTSGRAREGLFSMLQDSVIGATVLDLYAGSGALGLEAVSRGARRAVLVERQATALDRTVERLKADSGEIEVLRGDARQALTLLAKRGERFDLIFCDPPYGVAMELDAPKAIADVLSAGGLWILQTDRGPGGSEPEGWTLVKRRDYGRNVFLYFGRASSALDLRLSGDGSVFDRARGKC